MKAKTKVSPKKKKQTKIILAGKDAAIVFRVSGSMALFLPYAAGNKPVAEPTIKAALCATMLNNEDLLRQTNALLESRRDAKVTQTPMQEFHSAILEVIATLIKIDPPKASPEGRLLEGLAAAVEQYEKKEFPL